MVAVIAMLYKFDINLTEQDYIDYNHFHLLKSPYGTKQVFSLRVGIALVFLIGVLVTMVFGGFTLESFIESIPMILLLIVFELGLNKFIKWCVKDNIKRMKKAGKMAYTPKSVIEFTDDGFMEYTDENKTEHKYSAIERTSVLKGKIVYIHINNIMAYLIPFSSFESENQFDEFVEFIKSKNSNVDYYS